MSDVYIPLISALAGALIGAGASICTIWLQTKTQDRRAKLKHAADLALEDYKHSVQLKLNHRQEGRALEIPPVVSYLHYHIELMELLDKGTLTPETLAELKRKNREINNSLRG